MEDIKLQEFECEFKRQVTYLVKVQAVNHEHAKEIVSGLRKTELKDVAVVDDDYAYFTGQVIRRCNYCGKFFGGFLKFSGEFLKLPSFLTTRLGQP